MKNKYKKLIVIIYFAAIALSVIFYYTIPKENFVKAKTGEELKQSENEKQKIIDFLKVLPDKSLVDKYNIKSYDFNYQEKDLEITAEKGNELIFIDRKSSDDNKIEVYWYPQSMVVNDIDFSSRLKGPNIQLINNKLSIEDQKQEFNATQFSKDLVIGQFYEKQDEKNSNVHVGLNALLYIKIPKNLKVLEDEAYHYIEN